MVRVSFKTVVEFDDEGWESFQGQWTMPAAFLHSILKTVILEGFQSKYGIQPKSIGIFPSDQQSRIEPETVGA